jgi:hypothetical protein
MPHPSERDLLMFVDGELRDKRHAAKIERHLASCWDCRARLAQMEGAITEFVTVRRKLLDHRLDSTCFPSERTSRAVLGARLASIAASSHVSPWQWVRALPAIPKRPVWIAGSVAALLATLLVIEPLFAPSVSAMEVIANGKAAEQRLQQGMVTHQRVRIRRKSRVAPAEASVECDVWRSGVRRRVLVASGRSGATDHLRALYRARGADWDAPLSADSFSRLRASLGAVRDEVRGRDEITVTSTPLRQDEDATDVQRLELTVRRSDWHATSERIQLRDAEYELTELLDETVASGSLDPSIFGEPLLAAVTPVLPAPRVVSPAPALPPAVTAEQLDSAEIELREAFHRTWADVEEVPEIRRDADRIRFRLFTQTTRRKEEILAALSGIPLLAPEIEDAEAGATESQAASSTPGPAAGAAAQPQLYSTQPPLAKALQNYSGGLEPANTYLNAVRDSYLAVLVDASALARLAGRYPDPEWNRLSPDSQARLTRIAEDHAATVRTNLAVYLNLVSPVLDEMLVKQQFHLTPDVRANDGDCAAWRSSAGILVAELSRLETSFRRLFVEERVEQPVVLSATELLHQAVQSRSLLREHPLCQP